MCAVRPATHTTAVAIWGVQTETLINTKFDWSPELKELLLSARVRRRWTSPRHCRLPGMAHSDLTVVRLVLARPVRTTS